jgi:hypothetical protein
MMTFGKIPTYQGTEKFELGVSDDKRALTLTFSDFVARVGGGATVPVASRLFNFVAPLEGDDKRAEIEFSISAGLLTLDGASATIVCSVNGQTKSADFPAKSEQTVTHTLKFVADKPSECRLSVLLLAGRDSKNANSEAFLNVLSIDAEILPRPK